MILWIIIIIILLLLIPRNSEYEEKRVCMTAEETNTFLASDPDGFVASLNRWDLFARRVKTKQEYINKISRSGVECNVPRTLLDQADQVFRSKGDSAIADQPWLLAMTNGSYEDGYPHTRQNVIFLSGAVDVKTLVHEKLHIWHRYHPPNLTAMGFKYLKPRKGILRLRANPDVDGNVWEGFDKPMLALYNSDRPMNIGDVDTDPLLEHPYEYLAYNYMH
jgi:hypothetical protein